MPESRTEILNRFRNKIAEGKPIIGGGAGAGISAKFEEAGGIDLIVIYNSGRFRMSGHGSLAGLMPYGDANAIVMEMAAEVLPVVRNTPVLAGVCGTDPMRMMDRFLVDVKAAGFAGVQNFPTVGLIDGEFRANLQETKARGGPVIAVVTQGDTQAAELADDVIEVPAVADFLQPIVSVVPLQLLAYHIAVARGCDVDKPRNLAKSVTVE